MQARFLKLPALVVWLALISTAPAGAQTRLIRGDANQDGNVDISDGIKIVGFLFQQVIDGGTKDTLLADLQ